MRYEDADDFLMHHGIKGMKWGVRKKETSSEGGSSSGSEKSDDASGSTDAVTQRYMKAAKELSNKKLSNAEKNQNLLENEKKSLAKLESGDKKKGLTENQKIALVYTAVGLATVGYIMGSYYYEQKFGGGKEATAFQALTQSSKSRTWNMNNYITKEALSREGFTLKAGQTFHRLSTAAEGDFRNATYATSNLDDFNRYVTVFRHEKMTSKLTHVTFTAKEDIKVPDLTTVMETLKDNMKGQYGHEPTGMEVLKRYNSLSGSSWDSDSAVGLIDSLKKKGYSALVDEMDAGVIGESPLVLFNQELLSKKTNQPLTNSDIAKAQKSVKDFANRK